MFCKVNFFSVIGEREGKLPPKMRLAKLHVVFLMQLYSSNGLDLMLPG